MLRLSTFVCQVILCLCLAILSFSGVVSCAEPHARLGINLAGPVDYGTEHPFVDVFRLSRSWISQQKGAGWGKGPKLKLDKDGWVMSLEDDCWADTPLCTAGGHPSGIYTCIYEGVGEISISGGGAVIEKTNAVEKGKKVTILKVKVDAKGRGIWLRIKKTDARNPVRRIRFIMPGHEKTYEKEPWNPNLLKRWKDMKCLRFMDFMHTNNSQVALWSQRPKMSDAQWTWKGRGGIPLEMLIDLANRLNIDPWFCIPHQANDDYVRSFAGVLKKKLKPNLVPWIEYSNELWNGIFKQNAYAAKMGKEKHLGSTAWEAAWAYTGKRSIEIFKIMTGVWGDRAYMRVIASQGANPFVSNRILSAAKKEAGSSNFCDALAIAPYISLNIKGRGEMNAKEVSTWSVDKLLNYFEEKCLAKSLKWMDAQKAVADTYKIKLVAYEGGQHALGIQGGERNQRLTRLLNEMNRHPRMGKIYKTYFDAWKKKGGDLFCVFSSVVPSSKWGSWGLLEYDNQEAKTSPKYQAVMNWIKSNAVE